LLDEFAVLRRDNLQELASWNSWKSLMMSVPFL